MNLEGKVGVVTGSSRGVGKNIALELARAGADVVIAARTEAESDPKLPGTIYSTAEEIAAETGRRAIPVKVDVTKDEDLRKMVDEAMEKFSRVDILVNNAGIMIPGKLIDTPLKRWDLAWRVNVRAALAACQMVLPHMLKRGSGTIIFISSEAAEIKGEGNMSYSVTKQADRKVAEGLAEELKDTGVSVFAISPEGIVMSPGVLYHGTHEMYPGHDVEDPEDTGRAAVLLASGAIDDRSGEHFYSRALLRENAELVKG